MLRRSPHDLLAGLRGAGKHNVVEGQTRERLRLGNAATEDGDLIFRKGFPEHPREKLGAARTELRRLDHRAVARGERRQERTERQVQREVPRADDSDDALRLVLDVCAIGEEHDFSAAPEGFHPVPQIRQRVVCLQDGADHLDQPGFAGRTPAKVCVDRRHDLILVAPQHRLHRTQLVRAFGECRVRVAEKCRALRFENALHAVDGWVHSLSFA